MIGANGVYVFNDINVFANVCVLLRQCDVDYSVKAEIDEDDNGCFYVKFKIILGDCNEY